MDITFHHTPSLFQEAEEVLFLYANQLPISEPPYPDSPYCIPTQELARMTQEACRHIPQEDPTLRYFFQAYPLPQERNNPITCLARVLAYSFADLNLPCASQAIASLEEFLETAVREDYVFDGLHAMTINCLPRCQASSEFSGNGIRRLPAPLAFREKLQAVLDHPKEQLEPLAALMEPVTDYLRQALAPWVLRADSMAQAWEDQLRSMTPEQFFLDILHYPIAPPLSIKATILYFFPNMVMIGTSNDGATMKLMVSATAGVPWLLESDEFMSWELQALRLLGNPLRFKMLTALRQKSMSSREMAKELNMHLGSVTRDVNSMEEVRLLNSVRHGSRRRYNVNYAAIRVLAKHLLSLCPEETPPAENPDEPPEKGPGRSL